MFTYFYINEDGSIQRTSDSPQVLLGTFEVVAEIDASFMTEGYQEAFDAIVVSTSFIKDLLRAKRDKVLANTIWLNERHISQPAGSKTLTDAKYAEFQTYWQRLRDLPATDLSGITRFNIDTLFPAVPSV